MTKVITGAEILKHAKEVCAKEEDVFLAVAYWGEGACKKLGLKADSGNVHIVLNIEHGGTNPKELKYLKETFREQVCVNNALHAKIYASKGLAVLGSANASAFGLNWNGGGHAEAAVVLHGADAAAAMKLARAFYEDGEEVTDRHIEICQKNFGCRTVSKTVECNPFDVFLNGKKIFEEMPIIVSKGPISEESEQKVKNMQAESIDFASKDQYDPSRSQDHYDWKLNKDYFGKTCLEINYDSNELHFQLVRPRCEREKITSAFILNTTELNDLGLDWGGETVLSFPLDGQFSKQFTELHKAFPSSEETFTTGRDVYKKLKELGVS